jgi:cephalosporin hydroxylase
MFISIQDWSSSVVHPNDNDIRYDLSGHYRYCTGKYEIACKVKPKTIIEIGVRLGYSAHAFLSAVPTATYYGLDVWGGDHGDHGGTKIAGADYVHSMLKTHFSGATVVLHTCNTQAMSWPELPKADLFHVDGDHTTSGALNDMQKAFDLILPGSSMLVDDYDHLVEVKSAVDQFKTMFASRIRTWEYIKTYRGDVLFVKG